MLVSGGGAKNPAITGSSRAASRRLRSAPFDEVYFDGEAKEAVAFALLALLHVERAPRERHRGNRRAG